MYFFKRKPKTVDYFKQAKSWSDDVFGAVEQSRNRYQCAFFSSMFLNGLALIALTALSQIKTLVPLVVHHYTNGVTTVEQLNQETLPINKSQIESDLIRYITNRESYDISSYRSQYDLVTLLSDDNVRTQFASEQDRTAKEAPIHVLGTTHYREVHVYSINFLDNLILNQQEAGANHHNLAEIVFTLTDVDKATGQKREHHYNALISWTYTTPSSSPDIRWKNWDGFLVTRYSKQPRNVSSHKDL